jgi:hypothetical protein
MRPRHFASENDLGDVAQPVAIGASMRPRHFASENEPFSARLAGVMCSFNEAEAFCLGKPCKPISLKKPVSKLQ